VAASPVKGDNDNTETSLMASIIGRVFMKRNPSNNAICSATKPRRALLTPAIRWQFCEEELYPEEGDEYCYASLVIGNMTSAALQFGATKCLYGISQDEGGCLR
jgi:hypothetical protein